MLPECFHQSLIDIRDWPSRAAQVKDALILVQHLSERLHVVKHLVLDVYFLGTVTRKGESRFGDNTVFNKGLDLWDQS
jgi:hypothetical protein